MKNKKLRKDLIKSKIRNIKDSVNIVGDNMGKDFKDFSSSGLIKEGIYKKIEFSIESIIDICNIINSDLELGMPESEESIIKNLERANIFKKEILNLIIQMKKFRNVLIHKYGDIDDKKAFDNIKKGLKDFKILLDEIEKFLKNN